MYDRIKKIKHHRSLLKDLLLSSEYFGNLQEMFRNVPLAFGTIFENLQKSSKSG